MLKMEFFWQEKQPNYVELSEENEIRVWLAHKDGFSAARLVVGEQWREDGKVKIRLENNSSVVEVDADDIEKVRKIYF